MNHRLRDVRDRRTSAALFGGWLLASAAGWLALTGQGFTGRGEATASAHWPADSQLTHDGRRTLVVFLHPRCPCSRAALAELESVLSSAAGPPPRVLAVVATPRDADAAWTDSASVARCRRLAGAEVFLDEDGVESARFGAQVSGAVAWYDADGQLQYFGGVTAGRGHAGANIGADAVAGLLAGDRSVSEALPALGCRLITGDAEADRSQPPARRLTAEAVPAHGRVETAPRVASAARSN